jgi:hypothetical protein
MPSVILQFLPVIAGVFGVGLLVALLLLLRRRAARVHAEALAREERALQALSLLRDSRLVPPAMEQAVEVFDVDALLGTGLAAPAEAAPDAGQPPPARAVEPPDTFGQLGANSGQAKAADSAPAPRAAPPAPGTARGLGAEVPLRDLALVFFEARGYQASPASPAVMPIEYVLRHRGDPRRVYAFIALNERLTEERGGQLIEQAQSIGLERLLVTTEEGAERTVKRAMRRRGLRLMDRQSMDDELAKLEFRVAAKIVAVAGAREQARAG